MGALRSFIAAIAGAALLLGAAMSAGQAQKRVNLPIPDDDGDLQQAIAHAARIKAQSGQCRQCKAGGGKVDCDGANSAASAIDRLRLALYSMAGAGSNDGPMQDMLRDIVDHMAQVQKEYDKLADHTDTQRRGLAWSKFLSDSGKITLDVISLSSSLKDLKDYGDAQPSAVPGIGGLKVVPPDGGSLGGDLKMIDAMLETVNGAVGAADDIKSAHVNDKGFVNPNVANLLLIKGGASDLASAIRNYQAAAQAAQRAQELAKAAKTASELGVASANFAKASEFAAEGRKGLANLAAKVLGKWADYAQGQLAKDIAANEQMLAATDPVMAGLLADQLRIHRRQALWKQAFDAVRDAASAANSCAASCPGNLGLSPVPAPSGQSYGGVLKAANSAIAAANDKASGLASDKMCTEKKDDGSAPTGGLPGQAAAPAPCANPGGMSGAVENLACQESR